MRKVGMGTTKDEKAEVDLLREQNVALEKKLKDKPEQ